jgi:arsenite methyltransferase
VAGALTERDFVAKLEKAGFEGVEVVERTPLSVDDLSLYPLFTPEVLRLMRTLVARERQRRAAVAIVVRARKRS